MKSKTSFFNSVIFRKNLTRFAPVWCLYTLCLLLGMVLMLDRNIDYWFAANLASMCSGMAMINFGYALLTAQMLFGDLWNSRMCNALHALPLRRECWFNTHVVSGLFFSMLPTAIMTSAAEFFLVGNPSMENGWQIPLYFWVSSNLEYLFFFGLATLAVFCAGNRLGMAVIYTIANFGSYLAFFLIDTLVRPMYYGVVTPTDIFMLLCPVARIVQHPLLETQRNIHPDAVIPAGLEYEVSGTFAAVTNNWLYVAVLTVVGMALLLIAKGMYRRRKLECAGDFLSTRKLEPIFMVIFSITVGAVFQAVPQIFLGYTQQKYLFLGVGLVVGWFVGWMLLERQTRVFGSVKNWAGLTVLAAAVALTLYGASLDPFGVEDWVPDAQDVKSVTMVSGHRGVAELKTAEEIEDVIRIHQNVLEEKLTGEEADAQYVAAIEAVFELPLVQTGQISARDMAEKIGYRKYNRVDITYTLHNGWTTSREYWMWIDTEAAQIAKPYFNRIDAIFYHYNDIRSEADLWKLVQIPQYLIVNSTEVPADMLSEQLVADLVQAVIADSKAGTMVQTDGYHKGFVLDTEEHLEQYYHLDLHLGEEYLYFTVYADSENCLAWMEAYGIRELVDESTVQRTK